VSLLLAALFLAVAAPARAADSKWAELAKKKAATAPAKTTSKKSAPVASKTTSKKAAKEPARLPARSKGKVAAKAKEPPPPRGKLAVLAFDGESTSSFRNQVVRVLRSNGFKVMTSLRPVDSAEQYREMAATLGLAAYVDGDVQDDGSGCSATIRVRSGTTGQRVASATFSGERRRLPDDIGKTLWTRVGPTLQRARADAAKPRKAEHAPLRIDAGTPL
jgi:hypothetical protein